MKTSVALCTYNGEKYLGIQLDSILSQTLAVDEIVVCDDGSTDATISILNSYKEKNPSVFRIYQNEKNLRSVKNFEKAISLCENDIIFLSDQDDEWLPEKVEKMVALFQSARQTEVIATNAEIISEKNSYTQFSVWDIPSKSVASIKEILFFYQNFCTGATMAFRKEFMREIVPFPPEELFHHDEWIALNAVSKNKLHFLDEKLIRYRIHDSQQVGSVSLSEDELSRSLEKINLPPEKMNSDLIFSVLKKIKRKLIHIEHFRPEEHKSFFNYYVKAINDKSQKLTDIARNKFFLMYSFYKISGKI
ncbi:glycosyltransferase family 2 protein [Chryseobacterium sp.]|uniref:glycosyltransferase family 2 protein n=1 Tax=Chryseobacterium sp. TaxID=1871047 RepID=UPI0011C6EE85|nr:glycosyltransferase family 2 protein [Chryseobacterium sp.]TXF77220.1 glycosyltransferase family 2 protein [Chryseobacterium sp.]